MGEPREVKLVMGLLASDDKALQRAYKIITDEFGSTDLMSEIIPFSFTHYYNDEMGESILRQFVSFGRLILPADLWEIKRHTIELENSQRIGGRRIMNLDPGYLTLHSLALASTKEACYRVYVGNGIYGQAMLQYKKSKFLPFEFTYPDYADEKTLIFFDDVRQIYSRQIKSQGNTTAETLMN